MTLHNIVHYNKIKIKINPCNYREIYHNFYRLHNLEKLNILILKIPNILFDIIYYQLLFDIL